MIVQLDGGYTTTEGWTGITGNFSMGMNEVQMFQMNQPHNDDITNNNG